MNDHSNILSAYYRDLELMYEKEKEYLVKYGHTLSTKVLDPAAIQKENVSFCIENFQWE